LALVGTAAQQAQRPQLVQIHRYPLLEQLLLVVVMVVIGVPCLPLSHLFQVVLVEAVRVVVPGTRVPPELLGRGVLVAMAYLALEILTPLAAVGVPAQLGGRLLEVPQVMAAQV
jgi:hypothetical protein